MFKTTVGNVTQKRTIRPLFAVTQATPYPGFLNPAWDRSVDIYPGMVITKLVGEVFTPITAVTQYPFGLSALFVAPALGIDEVRASGTNNFTVWVGDSQATFEVLAPAFDTTADWATAAATATGVPVPLYSTITGHAAGAAKLTCTVPGTYVGAHKVAELISVVGTNKIVIRLARATAAAVTT